MPSAIRTTEFWVTFLAVVGSWIVAFVDVIPIQYAGIATVISISLYALSRAFAKYGTEYKKGWKTTEFWYAIAGSGVMILTALNTDWSLQWAAVFSAISLGFYEIGRGLLKSAPETQLTISKR